MKDFKDLFSKDSKNYALFRPRYPQKLYELVSGLAPKKNLAWDCGTGNGQAAVELAKYFTKVIATDPSEKQLESAEPNSKVEYRKAKAEESGLEAKSVDLIAVAQALHWFDFKKFEKEVERVIVPGGILAVWCYGVANITPEIDAIVEKLYKEILNGYWEKERQYIDDKYETIHFPWEKVAHSQVAMTAEWESKQWIGYLRTWSAVTGYLKKQGKDPVLEIESDLICAWGNAPKLVTWPLSLKIWRISK